MSFFKDFLSFYRLALRLAFVQLRAGKIHRGLYLLIRPIDYWRVFEFPISHEYLDAHPGERILDISSPKLFPMYEAVHSGAEVLATDIYDDMGLTDTRLFKESTGASQLHISTCDVRNLPFPDKSFDKVVSISVLEHVFPPDGGDVRALREIERVLKEDGIAVITLPFGTAHAVQYLGSRVYEREQDQSDGAVFYQRRYDASSLKRVLEQIDTLAIEQEEFICERFFHMKGKELCNILCEGNKVKRLSLAPFYSLFALVFLTRTSTPLPKSEYMGVCLRLRKRSPSPRRS